VSNLPTTGADGEAMNDPIFGCLTACAIFAFLLIILSAALGMDLGATP